MAQHDYIIDNQSFPSFRTDLNNVLAAIQSTNYGASAPSTTQPAQFFANQTTGRMQVRETGTTTFRDLFKLNEDWGGYRIITTGANAGYIWFPNGIQFTFSKHTFAGLNYTAPGFVSLTCTYPRAFSTIYTVHGTVTAGWANGIAYTFEGMSTSAVNLIWGDTVNHNPWTIEAMVWAVGLQ